MQSITGGRLVHCGAHLGCQHVRSGAPEDKSRNCLALAVPGPVHGNFFGGVPVFQTFLKMLTIACDHSHCRPLWSPPE